MSRTVAVISLGCAKNLVDAEVYLASLLADGYELTADEATADVVVVNTCAFIAPARAEAREVMADLGARMKPDATCAVVGCYPQREGAASPRLFPRADVILGVGADVSLAAAVREARAGRSVKCIGRPRPPLAALGERARLTAPHVSFLKIADGCDHGCTFCIVPRLRGPYRSRPEDDIVREADAQAARGVQELVLLAQDTSAYGRDLGDGADLAGLLRRLGRVGIPWLRVLYLNPARITDALAAAFADTAAVVNYFDIPLQHVAPHLLKAMARPTATPEKTLALLERLRRAVPRAALRTSFIVGFPGETPADFELLRDFLVAARLEHVGVFEFSAEEGTPAAALPGQVPAAVAAERRKRLMLDQQEVLASHYRRLRGKTFEVLLDRVDGDGVALGRTYFQAPETDPVTIVEGGAARAAGEFVRAEVTGHDGYELLARAVGAPARCRA